MSQVTNLQVDTSCKTVNRCEHLNLAKFKSCGARTNKGGINLNIQWSDLCQIFLQKGNSWETIKSKPNQPAPNLFTNSDRGYISVVKDWSKFSLTMLSVLTAGHKAYEGLVTLLSHIHQTPFPDCSCLLQYMGYIGMCRCEGYGFQAVYSSIGYINQSVWV